nr:hypothetical protein CFP56_16716 [Quercus suber]
MCCRTISASPPFVFLPDLSQSTGSEADTEHRSRISAIACSWSMCSNTLVFIVTILAPAASDVTPEDIVLTAISTQRLQLASPVMSQDADNQSEAFTTGSTTTTPMSTSPISDIGTFADQVPWPDNTYIIVARGTRQAITKTGNGVSLKEIDEENNEDQRWCCVTSNGYYGFYNAKARKYMGHDGKQDIRASASALKDWELFTPRQHPDGGYQLLSPFWSHTLMLVEIADGGQRLMRTKHGITLWEFEKV